MLGDSIAKVVHCAQIEMPFAQVPMTYSIAHLHVEAKVIEGFLVAPAKTSFERLESDQQVNRNVGARGLVIGIRNCGV